MRRPLTYARNRKRTELPKIIVKKEPTSPGPPSRHRPAKLNLSNALNASSGPNAAATPRTANGNLATIQDVGMACLSPGFSTQDPTMREQLQRSISVREQQRSIIESRLQRHAKQGPNAEPSSRADREEPASARDRSERGSDRSTHTPRRRPPNSLTIVPPPHRAFAHERVVQSAPLHQSFTGRHHPPPPSHHNPQSHLQNQEVNRLPPITDVFGPNRLDSAHGMRPQDEAVNRQYYPTTRPSYPSPNNMAYSRPREHRSAEEAIANMSGGREDLLPRIIHYGGHQPPTPPSPPQPAAHTPSKLTVNGVHEHPPHSGGGAKRRRTRDDYGERDGSCGSEDSPDAKRRKKEEFLALCARAWELFHS